MGRQKIGELFGSDGAAGSIPRPPLAGPGEGVHDAPHPLCPERASSALWGVGHALHPAPSPRK